jgi:hypothetical protein
MAQVALTYSYVYLGAAGRHERRPVRTPGGPGGFELISQKSGGTLQTGDQFQIGVPLPPTQSVDRVTYNFAFVNVSGGTPSGAQVSFDSANPPPYVTVASSPINVLVLYVPPSGRGGGRGAGDSGATIDSFDETTGSLFNDIFVTVVPDPNGVLTASGNDLGFVDTIKSQEAITAISPTSSGVIFDQWRILLPPEPVAGPILKVGKGVSVDALAFYKAPSPPPSPSPEQQACAQAAESLQQIINDPTAPLLLPAQFNQVKATLERCVREGYLTQALVDRLLAEYATIGISRGESRNPPSRPGT